MSPKALNTATYWKFLLAALVAFFIGAQVVTMVFASKKVGRVVDPDYYKNGKNYSQDLHKAQAARPDWIISPSLQADHLLVTVFDRAGMAISGGIGRLELSGVLPMELVEATPGVYRSREAIKSSELRGTISISKGDALFIDRVALFR